MELIYLHGAPASGKFTLAQGLSELLGARVFHNHLTIDVAKALFDFDTPPFWNLVQELRIASLRAAATHQNGPVIYTACYDHPSDLPLVEQIETTIAPFGGRLRPVFLKCSPLELERRVTEPSRVAMGKLHSVAGLRAALARWNFVPVPRSNCVTVETDGRTVAECVDELVAVLGIEG